MQGSSQRQYVSLWVVLVSLVLATQAKAGTGAAGCQGVVRDSNGVAQMGALVQVLAANSVTSATAFTDLHGRYVIANLLPGRYQVRASAALYIPAVRSNLELKTGTHTVVNLTLATLFQSATWLPSERRSTDQASDDWMWTLRSPVNRPMLRILEDGTDSEEILGNALNDTGATAPQGPKTNLSLSNAGGVFGGSGPIAKVVYSRDLSSHARTMLQARSDADTGRLSQLATGLLQPSGPGTTATIVRYSSYPELDGLEVLDLSSAQEFTLGDTVRAELGGNVRTVRQHAAYRVQMQPFLRVTGRTSNGWTVQYRLAASPNLQGFDDLVLVGDHVPVAVTSAGNLLLEGGGKHQEFTIARAAVRNAVQLAVFHDASDRTAIAGIGLLGPRDGLEVDRTSRSFRVLGRGAANTGLRAEIDAPLTPHLIGSAEYTRGRALEGPSTTVVSPPLLASALKSHGTQAASLSIRGKVGATKLRASYRWQSGRTVSAVNPYGNLGDKAFLSADLRQPIRWSGHLPPGIEANLNITNLLAQGYRPFLSDDGQTLYLAQAPRTLQAGLAFAF